MDTRSDQRARVVKLIYDILNRNPDLFDDPLAVKMEAELEADSLDAIEIAMDLEGEFAIEIDDDEVTALGKAEDGATVGDWWKLVEAKLAEAGR